MRQERRGGEIKSSSKPGFSSLLVMPSFFSLLSLSPRQGAASLMFAVGRLLPGAFLLPPTSPFFPGLQRVNKESVGIFSRNNGFSEGCHQGRGLEGGSPGIPEQRRARCSIPQGLASIQETFNSKPLHLFNFQGGRGKKSGAFFRCESLGALLVFCMEVCVNP